MKKEAGIVYKTVCDKCGADVENKIVGAKCDVCGKDLCRKCRGTTLQVSFGDIYSDEYLHICGECNEQNKAPPRITAIITLIQSLNELDVKGIELYNLIESRIQEVKKLDRS